MLPTKILRVNFQLFKLLYKWLMSLWLNHHCVFFMFFCELRFVPLASVVPTFESLWLPLGSLGLLVGVLWDPFDRPGAYGVWLKIIKNTNDYRWEGLQFDDTTCDYRRDELKIIKCWLRHGCPYVAECIVFNPKMSFGEFIRGYHGCCRSGGMNCCPPPSTRWGSGWHEFHKLPQTTI